MYFEISHLHLEEAFLTTTSLPFGLQARAGYMNAAFGRQNPRHVHTWNFVNPPLSHTRFMGEEHFSGLGAETSVLFPLPWFLTVGLQAFDTKPKAHLRTASFGTSDYTKTGKFDGPEDCVYIGRIKNFFALSHDWSLNIGLSAAIGHSPFSPDGRSEVFGSDIYLKWRPISSGRDAVAVALTLEYIGRRAQIPSDVLLDHGGYAQVDVQSSRQWMFGLRGGYTGLLEPVDGSVLELDDQQWRTGFSVTHMPTHFSRVRMQYDLGNFTPSGVGTGNNEIYHAVFFQVEVGIGKHAAHSF